MRIITNNQQPLADSIPNMTPRKYTQLVDELHPVALQVLPNELCRFPNQAARLATLAHTCTHYLKIS